MTFQEIIQLMLDSFMKILIPGLTRTIPLTVLSFSFAMVIAVICALIQYAKVPVLKEIVRFYVWIIRGTPLLVQLLIGFYGLISIGIKLQPFTAAVLVFSINEGAYCSETLRGSLESVSYGQFEAGYCAGMNFIQIMRHIVLPQAFRTAFPALGNSLISMLKDTSLVSNITVTEMLYAAQKVAGKTYQYMAMYIEVALIYLAFSTVLTWLQKKGERKQDYYGGN
jgi:cystine transport system permease protein